MTELSIHEKARTVRANILADSIARAVQWLCFAAIVFAFVLPLAWGAMRAHGIVPGLAVMALCLALAWHVKPQGRSAAAQCRDLEARYKPHY